MFDNNKNLELDESKFVDSQNRAILGVVNGILFYNYVYPFVLLIFFQLVLGAAFDQTVENNYYLIQMLLNLLTSLLTLVIGILIASPKKFLKAVKIPHLDDVKLMFSTLIIMMVATIGYNFIITLLGVDVGAGNTNQESIVDYIKNAPILSFATFVLIGPFLEEVTYRYFLFGSLRKIHPTLAIVLSGFIFMLVHGIAGFMKEDVNIIKELILLPPYMFSGCMLAYAYNKSENLATSTGTHVLNNLISFILSAL